jgi:hypothetical protein
MPVHQEQNLVVISAILNVLPTIREVVQLAGVTALLTGLILEPNARRSLMVEELADQYTLAPMEPIKAVFFAILTARMATMESDQFAGNPAKLVGKILVHSALSHSISMVKDAVALSGVAAIIANLDTTMMVAPAEEILKLRRKTAMVMELDLQWVAQITKIKMLVSAIQNVKLVTLE